MGEDTVKFFSPLLGWGSQNNLTSMGGINYFVLL